MKTEFRNRAFLPVVLPLAILLVVGLLVGGFALILLYNTHEAALTLAAVAAAGILIAVSLASSKEHLNGVQKGVVVGAAALPVVLGGLFAVGLVDIPEEDLNINREPHLAVPDDAVIGATSIDSFCNIQEDGSCVDSREWEVATQGPEAFVFEFDNRDGGVSHNVALFTLADPDIAPEDLQADSGEESLFVGEVFPGPESRVYDAEPGLEAGNYFYQCSVHPSTMVGVLTVTEGGEGGAA